MRTCLHFSHARIRTQDLRLTRLNKKYFMYVSNND